MSDAINKILGELLGITGTTTIWDEPQPVEVAENDYIYGTDLLGATRPLLRRAATSPIQKGPGGAPQRAGFTLKRPRAGGKPFTSLQPGRPRPGNHEMSIKNARDVGKRAQAIGRRLLKAVNKAGIHGLVAPTKRDGRPLPRKKAMAGKFLTSAQLKQIAERAIKAGKKVVSAADDHERKVRARNLRLKPPKIMLRGDWWDEGQATNPWDSRVAYSEGYKVFFNGKTWKATRPSTGEEPFESPSGNSPWIVIGDDGYTEIVGGRKKKKVPKKEPYPYDLYVDSQGNPIGGDDYTEIIGAQRIIPGQPRDDFEVLGRRGERDAFSVLGEDGYTEIIGAPTDPDPLNPGFLINAEPDPNYGGGYPDPFAAGAVDPTIPYDPNDPYGLGTPPTLESVRAELLRMAIKDPGPERDSTFYSSDPTAAPGAPPPLGAVYCDFSQGVPNWVVGSFNHFFGGADGLSLKAGDGWIYFTDNGTKEREVQPDQASGDRGPYVRQLSELSRRSGWGPLVGNPMTSGGSHLPPKSWPYGLRFDAGYAPDGAWFWFRDMAPTWASATEEQAALNQAMLDYRAKVAAAAADAAAAAAEEKLETAYADQYAKQTMKEDQQLARQYEVQDAQIMLQQQQMEAQQAAYEQQFMQQQMTMEQQQEGQFGALEQQYQQMLLQQMQEQGYPGENGQSGGAPWGIDENYQPGVDWDDDGVPDESYPADASEAGVDWGE